MLLPGWIYQSVDRVRKCTHTGAHTGLQTRDLSHGCMVSALQGSAAGPSPSPFLLPTLKTQIHSQCVSVLDVSLYPGQFQICQLELVNRFIKLSISGKGFTRYGHLQNHF